MVDLDPSGSYSDFVAQLLRHQANSPSNTYGNTSFPATQFNNGMSCHPADNHQQINSRSCGGPSYSTGLFNNGFSCNPAEWNPSSRNDSPRPVHYGPSTTGKPSGCYTGGYPPPISSWPEPALTRPYQPHYQPPYHPNPRQTPPPVVRPSTPGSIMRPLWQTSPQPLIPAGILTSNVYHQLESSLFTKLPTEILHRILLLAIERPTTNQSHDMITRVFITLTSKLLANHLVAACSALPSNTPGMSGGGLLLKKDIPRNFYTKTAPSAHITARINFMDKMGLWLRPEDGWALCAVCLAYKQTKGGSLGAEKGSWRSMKKVNISGTRMMQAAGDAIRMVRNFVIATRSPKDVCEEEDWANLKVQDADVADNETWKTSLVQQGWMEMGEEHLICPKHRFTAQQMIQLRDK